ncbi:methyltransferase domain-containing protein [Aquabacterium sp.]|uniref:methyltransferase domain-containing protein n=1 Tax=Aquabacterium sp. TaxID=1872578 RepID=UPI002B8F1E60|nr:methyltransferase domain-containing protein [Aquabacterium sp.]HSW03342.1 methyltransferase domain-containing protein [Aquabacterium sp.]
MHDTRLQQIHHCRIVDERLATSGQPSEDQLAAIARAGYQVIINLALHDDPRYSLPDEAGSVAALGLPYVHIPVQFKAPTRDDLLRFCDAMDAYIARKTWVHCAANYRVTAFVGLYRVLRQGWAKDDAFALMHEVWQPDATWQAFIDEQLLGAYYARRAATYERMYQKPERQAELRLMEAAMPTLFESRRVLEIACGTGWWTPFGAARAQRWLATDLNPETMDVARTKPMPTCVEFRSVDAYTLAELGDETFDAAFAGFWWSHVPLARLAGWLATLHARLVPGARVVMLDNRFVAGSSTPISRTDDEGNSYQQRPLDDGSTHEVLKNFPSAEQARTMLRPYTDDLQWIEHPHYWVLSYRFGGAQPAPGRLTAHTPP